LVPLGRALSDPRLAGNTFLIAGHSDGRGSADYNVDLSQKRAEAVRLHLITKFGVGAERLVAKGMGAKQLKNAKDPLAAENVVCKSSMFRKARG
jgi:outer membrane protein OmpA-like peptidoglycan-associated protein